MTAIRVTTCAALLLLGAITDGAIGHRSDAGQRRGQAVQTGTAVIDGIVVSDDADARPLRRVRVASSRRIGRSRARW